MIFYVEDLWSGFSWRVSCWMQAVATCKGNHVPHGRYEDCRLHHRDARNGRHPPVTNVGTSCHPPTAPRKFPLRMSCLRLGWNSRNGQIRWPAATRARAKRGRDLQENPGRPGILATVVPPFKLHSHVPPANAALSQPKNERIEAQIPVGCAELFS